MGNVEPIGRYLEPLRKAIDVAIPVHEAFAIFTERLGAWWPRERGYSVFQGESARCGIEPRVGGEVFELSTDGRRAVWGTVLVWDPPLRLVMTWHPGRGPDTAQEVEVRFEAIGDGTRVHLEHRGWAKLGAEAGKTRQSYENGWAIVFDRCYKEACES